MTIRRIRGARRGAGWISRVRLEPARRVVVEAAVDDKGNVTVPRLGKIPFPDHEMERPEAKSRPHSRSSHVETLYFRLVVLSDEADRSRRAGRRAGRGLDVSDRDGPAPRCPAGDSQRRRRIPDYLALREGAEVHAADLRSLTNAPAGSNRSSPPSDHSRLGNDAPSG